jgi:hypothetical protein
MNAKLTFKSPYSGVIYGIGFAVIFVTVPWYYFVIFLPLVLAGIVPWLFIDLVVARLESWLGQRMSRDIEDCDSELDRSNRHAPSAEFRIWDLAIGRFLGAIGVASVLLLLTVPTSYWMPFERIKPEGQPEFTAFVLARDADELVLLTPVQSKIVRIPAQGAVRELCNPTTVTTEFRALFREANGKLDWLARADFQPTMAQLLYGGPRPMLTPCPALLSP